MKKKSDISFILATVVCLVPFLLSAIFYNDLPEQVATHFAYDGTPDGYSSKNVAAFGIPFISLIAYFIIYFFVINDPKKQNISNKIRNLIIWIFPIISIASQMFVITYAVEKSINISMYFSLGMGVFFILIGNYLPKCRQNYTIGIKIPWTVKEDIRNPLRYLLIT